MSRPLTAALVVIALTVPASSQAQTEQGVRVARAGGSGPVLMSPQPRVLCGDALVSPIRSADIAPGTYDGVFTGRQTGQRLGRTAHAFSIDPTGRPRDIRLAGPPSPDAARVAYEQPRPDIDAATQANLAGWTFPPEARSDCLLDITYTPVPLSRAAPPLLHRYYAVTRNGLARDAVQAVLQNGSGDCDDRGPRQIGYPDYTVGDVTPGRQSWTILRWNLGADGRRSAIETLASSGDTAFDAETRRAAADTLLGPGAAVSGCVYNHYRRTGILHAPDPAPAPRDILADCPPAVLARFRTQIDPRPPRAFELTGIEGSALIRFDIAPWGAIGNVAVIEAQPAAAFGAAAVGLVQSGRADPAPRAGIRCVHRVDFRIARDDGETYAAD